MTTCYNPSLSEEPRNQPIAVVPPIAQESLLGWLERTGRFYFNEDGIDASQAHKMPEDLDDILEPEVYGLEDEDEQID